jgi:hypothetical protein
MKSLLRVSLFALALLTAQTVMAATSFARFPSQVQILDDRVRMYIGTTFGTCGEHEGWVGWSIAHPRHKDWLDLTMLAIQEGKLLIFHDAQDSCYGPGGDTLEIDALYLKLQ